MNKYLRRSEYHHALNLARRARRRGDVIESDRWLRHAGHHLQNAERLQASEDASRLRDIEYEAARTLKTGELQEKRHAEIYQALRERLRNLEESC